MEIIYKFADGTTSKVEVTDGIGDFILDSRRREDNDDRRYRYHNYSLEAITYEGSEYGKNDEYPSEDDSGEVANRVREAISRLNDTQRRRLLMLSQGMSLHEIAAAEGVAFNAVRESVNRAKKKFLKIF